VAAVTVRGIRVLGDPVLRTVCDAVTSFDAELRALVEDLLDTVSEPGRAGVAAPQIGVAARVFSFSVGDQRGYLVNPRITALDGTQDGPEGCLSIPELFFPTPRALTATAEGVDVHGEPITVTGTGLLARALQHETDHLDGKLYIDGLTGDTRRKALRAVRSTFTR
jgi:peptide deformylase